MAFRRVGISRPLRSVSAAYARLRAAPTTVEQHNLRCLLVFTALFGVVQGGILTYLPVFLVRLGASAVMVSLITSLPALLTIVLALPAGTIVNRWRRPVHMSARCFYVL